MFQAPRLARPPHPVPGPERLAIFRAIASNDVNFLLDHVITPGHVSLQWPLPHASDVPDLLSYSPPALSIAAYLGASDAFSYLLLNHADPNQPDRVSFISIMAFFLFNIAFPFILPVAVAIRI
jgi:hypothetical protein